MRKSESETEKVSEGGTRTGGGEEGEEGEETAVRAFRARLPRLLKRNREKKKGERENTERKREGTKRGVIVQGESGPYGEKKREGKPRLQHCKRQRCTLPGGRSDNMYRGPPATMPIFRAGWKGEGCLIRKETGIEKSRSESRRRLLAPAPK